MIFQNEQVTPLSTLSEAEKTKQQEYSRKVYINKLILWALIIIIVSINFYSINQTNRLNNKILKEHNEHLVSTSRVSVIQQQGDQPLIIQPNSSIKNEEVKKKVLMLRKEQKKKQEERQRERERKKQEDQQIEKQKQKQKQKQEEKQRENQKQKLKKQFSASEKQSWLDAHNKNNPKSLINFFKINSKGQKIDSIFSQSQRNIRERFNKERLTFINSQEAPFVKLGRYNMITEIEQLQEKQRVQTEQFERLEKKFNLSSYSTQLPFCIFTTGFNNNKNFRIQLSLNSIFTQNYTNYQVVIVNDASTDGSGEVYKKYLEFYDIPKQKYSYVDNQIRKVSVQNIYKNTVKYCRDDSILVIVDADDEVLGKNVLKMLNSVYQKTNSGVVFTNYIMFAYGSKVVLGYSYPYSKKQIEQNRFRKVNYRASHLRTYRTQLVKRMDIQYLKFNGSYIFKGADQALSNTIMEMSCGRVTFVQGELSYIYHLTENSIAATVSNRAQIARDIMVNIRQKKPAQCDKKFQQKVKELQRKKL